MLSWGTLPTAFVIKTRMMMIKVILIITTTTGRMTVIMTIMTLTIKERQINQILICSHLV